MEPWVIAILLKPFGALILFGCIALPLRLLYEKHAPEGKLKKFLLRRISGSR